MHDQQNIKIWDQVSHCQFQRNVPCYTVEFMYQSSCMFHAESGKFDRGHPIV